MGKQRRSDIGQHLDWTLISADLWGVTGVIGTGVDVQHVLHVPDEGGTLVGRNAPQLLARLARRRSAGGLKNTQS